MQSTARVSSPDESGGVMGASSVASGSGGVVEAGGAAAAAASEALSDAVDMILSRDGKSYTGRVRERDGGL